MPYSIKKVDGFNIVNKRTKKKVGHSSTLAKAKSSVRARLAGEHGWKPTGQKRKFKW